MRESKLGIFAQIYLLVQKIQTRKQKSKREQRHGIPKVITVNAFECKNRLLGYFSGSCLPEGKENLSTHTRKHAHTHKMHI